MTISGWIPAHPRMGMAQAGNTGSGGGLTTFLLMEAAGLGSLLFSGSADQPVRSLGQVGGVALMGLGFLSLMGTRASAQESSPDALALAVLIDGHDYVVDGKVVSLTHVLELSEAILDSVAPAVIITRQNNSRARSEVHLINGLKERSISFQIVNNFTEE